MDKEFDELKELFQHKTTAVALSTEDMSNRAKNDLSELKRNHLKNIVMLLSTAFALVMINKVNSDKIEVSVWGFALLLLCAVYYALSKMYLLIQLRAIKPTNNVFQVITQLERYNTLNTFMHTYGEAIYLLVLNVGVYLYLHPVMAAFQIHISGNSILYIGLIWIAWFGWMMYYTFGIKRSRMKKDRSIIENYKLSLKME